MASAPVRRAAFEQQAAEVADLLPHACRAAVLAGGERLQRRFEAMGIVLEGANIAGATDNARVCEGLRAFMEGRLQEGPQGGGPP